jgi:xylan 1,4-beta-xylosidase
MTTKEYRAMQRLTRFLLITLCLHGGALLAQQGVRDRAASFNRTINVDAMKIRGGRNSMFNACVGAGRANEGLRADWQEQLAVAHRECGFRYIRMHGLLTDDMGVYREDADGLPEYNFQYVDQLIDAIVRIGMKPFIELGFMPEALASGRKTIFWWRGNVTPPKDYDKWAGLVEALTLHLTERYGVDEVKTWYFEVWNEPNLDGFWAGSQDQYYSLYKYSVAAIKGVNKKYRVGGPATAGAAWVPETIAFCKKNTLPLDFISTHSYGVRQGYLDEHGNTGTVLDRDPMSLSRDVLQSRDQITHSAMPGIELHYTEWSASYTPTDPIHDSYHEAAYILQKLRQVGDAAQSMSYWTFTDIFEEAGPRFTPFHGGFGLMNYQGIRKPAFYAFSFLNRLGDTELVCSDSCTWACQSRNGDLQILFWDFTITLPKDSVNNQAYYIRDLPSHSKGQTGVRINGVQPGTYSLSISRIGYRVNDAYSTYITLGRPAQLTPAQVAAIKQINDGAPILRDVVNIGGDGVFFTKVELRDNDVYLVELQPLKH